MEYCIICEQPIPAEREGEMFCSDECYAIYLDVEDDNVIRDETY